MKEYFEVWEGQLSDVIGEKASQDLLGYVTVSKGGLTLNDLVEIKPEILSLGRCLSKPSITYNVLYPEVKKKDIGSSIPASKIIGWRRWGKANVVITKYLSWHTVRVKLRNPKEASMPGKIMPNT